MPINTTAGLDGTVRNRTIEKFLDNVFGEGSTGFGEANVDNVTQYIKHDEGKAEIQLCNVP